MENYEKGETVENEPDHREPFATVISLPDDLLLMKVRGGSKIQAVVESALRGMNAEDGSKRSVVFYGAGPAISKTITCVEILKRRIKDLQQVNKLAYQEVQEIWNPKLEGLSVLKVSRKIPVIHVLLSKDVLNSDEPGFQRS